MASLIFKETTHKTKQRKTKQNKTKVKQKRLSHPPLPIAELLRGNPTLTTDEVVNRCRNGAA